MTHPRLSSFVAAGDVGRIATKPRGVSLACAVLMVSVMAVAPQGNAQKKKPSPYSMSGCLQKTDNNVFRLTGVEGGGRKTIEIVSAAKGANLSVHVGHRVEITGTTVNAKKVAKAEGKKKNEVKEVRGELHMRVRSVKMLAASCS